MQPTTNAMSDQEPRRTGRPEEVRKSPAQTWKPILDARCTRVGPWEEMAPPFRRMQSRLDFTRGAAVPSSAATVQASENSPLPSAAVRRRPAGSQRQTVLPWRASRQAEETVTTQNATSTLTSQCFDDLETSVAVVSAETCLW